jgi:hypothetical protein
MSSKEEEATAKEHVETRSSECIPIICWRRTAFNLTFAVSPYQLVRPFHIPHSSHHV